MNRKPPAIKFTYREAIVLAVGLSAGLAVSAFAGVAGVAGGVALAVVTVGIVWFMRSRRPHTGDTYVIAGLTGWDTFVLVGGCAASVRFFLVPEILAYVIGFLILSGSIMSLFLSHRQRVRGLDIR